MGANSAFDSAADPVYSGGWTNGSNGGYGLGPWSGAGFLGASGTSIDTGGASWALHTGSSVGRAFTGGPLTIGDVVNVDLDIGFVAGRVADTGFFLKDSAGDIRFAFYVANNGGAITYLIHDAELGNTGILDTNQALHLSFQLTDIDHYTLKVTDLSAGTTFSFSRELGVAQGEPLYSFGFANLTNLSGSNDDEFFNALQVIAIPEPSTVALVILGAVALAMLRRRR